MQSAPAKPRSYWQSLTSWDSPDEVLQLVACGWWRWRATLITGSCESRDWRQVRDQLLRARVMKSNSILQHEKRCLQISTSNGLTISPQEQDSDLFSKREPFLTHSCVPCFRSAICFDPHQIQLLPSSAITELLPRRNKQELSSNPHFPPQHQSSACTKTRTTKQRDLFPPDWFSKHDWRLELWPHQDDSRPRATKPTPDLECLVEHICACEVGIRG